VPPVYELAKSFITFYEHHRLTGLPMQRRLSIILEDMTLCGRASLEFRGTLASAQRRPSPISVGGFGGVWEVGILLYDTQRNMQLLFNKEIMSRLRLRGGKSTRGL